MVDLPFTTVTSETYQLSVQYDQLETDPTRKVLSLIVLVVDVHLEKASPKLRKMSTITTSKPRVLSKRETEILTLTSQGLTVKEMAQKLFISPLTVASHRKNMMEKLHARNMACLVRVGFEIGILRIPKTTEE